MRFRPCIDLREGKVVQIVGGSLREGEGQAPQTNFQTDRSAVEFAELYRRDGLTGGHVISLGPGNRAAALAALGAFPGGMQVGGGIKPENAKSFLDAGASHVIVTSYVIRDGRVDMERLAAMVKAVGKQRLVLDLSCRKRGDSFWVVSDRWQTFTNVQVNAETLSGLSAHCDEFLVHGVDVEGRMQGIQADLVELLGAQTSAPVTYAGGVKSMADLERVNELGRGRVDLTIGSALDLFGGKLSYRDVVAWSHAAQGREENPGSALHANPGCGGPGP